MGTPAHLSLLKCAEAKLPETVLQDRLSTYVCMLTYPALDGPGKLMCPYICSHVLP